MSDTAYDGTPLHAGPLDPQLTGSFPQFSMIGFREMVVVARRYKKDKFNRTKTQVEYDVRDLRTGDLFTAARRVDMMSGTTNGDDNVLHPAGKVRKNSAGVVGPQSPAGTTDGDRVLVGFIEGSRSQPVILGVFRHPDATYGAAEADGERRLTTHAGASVEIDKDGNVRVQPAPGKDVFIGNQGATENLVLGQKFKTFAEGLIDALLAATYPTGTGPSGPMLPPQATTLATLKAQLNDLLSDMAFTQKEQS